MLWGFMGSGFRNSGVSTSRFGLSIWSYGLGSWKSFCLEHYSHVATPSMAPFCGHGEHRTKCTSASTKLRCKYVEIVRELQGFFSNSGS